MRLVNLQTNQLEDVPDEQAHSAYVSGNYGLDPNSTVPVKDKYGDIKPVAATDVDKQLADGVSQIVSPSALAAQEQHKKYGGLGGQVIAGAEGAARGASLGTSDLLAVEAARAFGGEKEAKAVQEHLAGERAENPYTSVGGEILGAVAPALATGGESAVAEGVGLAEEAGRGVQLAEEGATLAKPSLLARVAGYTPTGAISRVGRAIEGAAGDVLGAPAAKTALGRIARLAAAKAPVLATEGAIYSAAGQFDEQALGGPAVTGQKLVAALGHGALWNTILGGVGEAGLAGLGALGRKATPYLERAASDKAFEMLGSAGSTASKEVEAVGGSKAVGQAVQKGLDLGEGGLQKSLAQGLLTPEKLVPQLDEAITKQKAAVDDFLSKNIVTVKGTPTYEGISSLDPQLKKALLKDNLDKFDELSADIKKLQVAKDIAEKSATSGAKAAGLGTIQGAGVFHAVTQAAAGNIPGAIHGALTAVAGKGLKEHQAAVAATLLSKISKLDFIARAVNQVDTTMRTGIEAAIMGKSIGSGTFDHKFSGPDRGASPESKWEHSRNYGSTRALATTEHLDQIIPQLSVHAPKIAQAAVQAMNQGVMVAKLSQPKAINKPTLSDPNPTPRVSTTDAEEHYEEIRAIEDPATTLSAGFAEGRLNPLQIKAIEGSSPDLLEDFKKQILDTLSKPHPPLKDAQIRCLEYLFNGQGDELSDPQMGMMLQKTYQQPSEPATRPAVAPSRVKPVTGTADATKTQLQKVSDRR